MEEILKFASSPISQRKNLLIYLFRIFQSVILTNYYMNNLDYYYDSSIPITLSNVILFILSYKFIIVLIIFTCSFCIVFWAIDIVIVLVYVLLNMIVALFSKSMDWATGTKYWTTIKILELSKLIVKEKKSDEYKFESNYSRIIVKELYQNYGTLTFSSKIIIKLKVLLSILLVSYFILNLYDIQYCIPNYLYSIIDLFTKCSCIISFCLFGGAVLFSQSLSYIYFDLIEKENKN